MNRLNRTRFIQQEELAQSLVEIDLRAKSVQAAGMPMVVKNQKAYVDNSDSHSIVFGATGSKKTRLLAMPTVEILGQAGESFVVTDPKGEIYEKTAAHMEERGYNVYCLNLRNLHGASTWNPLRLPCQLYRDGKKAKAMELLGGVLDAMIVDDGEMGGYWTSTSRDVVMGFILMMFERAEDETCNLKSLLGYWEDYVDNRKEILKKIRELYKGTSVSRKLSSLFNNSDKTTGSVESIVSMGLNKLANNEDLVDFLSQEGLPIEELCEGKTAIYLVVPDENRFYHFVVSVFLEQLYEVLIQTAQKNERGALPRRMNFVIDEFANIPTIANMDSMITAARSRNIRFYLFVQGMQQLEAKYRDKAKVICGNCNNWIYLYSKEFELLEELSRICGEVLYENNIRQPLISTFDLQHLNKETGEALVLSGRNCPCIVNLQDIDDYPYEKAGLPESVAGDRWRKVYVDSLERILKEEPGEESTVLSDKVKESRFTVIRNKINRNIERDIQEDITSKNAAFLVATYRDMIFEMYTVNENMIEEAIVSIAPQLFKNVEDMARLEWYRTDIAVAEQILKQFEEGFSGKCYVTMSELGAEYFYRLENPISGMRIFNNKKTKNVCYEMKMPITSCKGEKIREQDFGKWVDRGTTIGLLYAMGYFMRKVNAFCDDLDLDKADWTSKDMRYRGRNEFVFKRYQQDFDTYQFSAILSWSDIK